MADGTGATLAAGTDPGGTTRAAAPPRRKGSSGAARRGSRSRRGGAVDDAGGFVLAVMVWGWVILPFLQGGPGRVRDVLEAKFLNKSDGVPLP